MISVIWTVMCDVCNWWDDRTVSNESRADALRKAKAAGWEIVTSATRPVHRCPACTGKIKSPEAP